jgi:ABC-type Fe3+-hydroxamate transport system substrate-binding protein
MRHPVRLATVLIAAAALTAGCGGNKAANNAANSATTNTAGGLTTGNDASAMETMTPAPTTTPAPATPTTTTGNSTAPSGNAIGAPPPVVDTDTAPGGDRGGNSQKQTPGI